MFKTRYEIFESIKNALRDDNVDEMKRILGNDNKTHATNALMQLQFPKQPHGFSPSISIFEMAAAESCAQNTLQYLLDIGVNVYAHNKNGVTTLQSCVMSEQNGDIKRRLSCIRLLLAHPDIGMSVMMTKPYENLITLAIKARRDPLILKLLLRRGDTHLAMMKCVSMQHLYHYALIDAVAEMHAQYIRCILVNINPSIISTTHWALCSLITLGAHALHVHHITPRYDGWLLSA